jgi:hypothetical protein
MTDKNGTSIAHPNRLNHFVDMALEVGSIRRPVTEPREREGLNLVPFVRERIADGFECPTAVPPTGDQNESCHLICSL